MDTVSVWNEKDGKFYIPPEDKEIHLLIAELLTYGLGGLLGSNATVHVVQENVNWTNLENDAHPFV